MHIANHTGSKKKSTEEEKKHKKQKKKKIFENCHLVVNCRFTFVTHYLDCFAIDLNASSETESDKRVHKI